MIVPVLRRASMRPALLRHAVASKAARAACQIPKLFSRFSAGNALLPGRPPCPTSSSHPPPAASRRAAPDDAVSSPRALPHSVARASRSRRAPCKDAARAAELRRSFQSCPRRVPNSQTVLPILRRQRLVARPSALPQVFCAPVARGLAGRCCSRRFDLAVPLPHWVARASCSRLVACKDVARAVARRLRLLQLPAPRAEFAHHSSDSPRQRLAAPPAAPPHVFSRASPTACAQRSDIATRLAISRCSRVSLPSLRRAKMRPALLLRGPVSKAARAGCPLR